MMKKTIKVFSWILLSFAILVGAGAFFLSHYVDPNKFKGRISQYVYAKTGQVLVINGNMNWSVFPWIGLKANDLAYYNAPGFVPKVFVSAKEMDIKIKVVPLFTGKVEVGKITLDNATLNLIKNKAGQYNWQTVGKDKKENQDVSKHDNAMTKLSIASLKIKNGKLNWYDQQNDTKKLITDLNISSKHIQTNKPFPVSLQFALLNDQKQKQLELDLSSDISLSSDQQQYSLKNIDITGDYFKEKNKISLKASGDLTADLQTEKLMTELDFVFGDAKGKLNMQGTSINNKPHLTGTVVLDEFNLKNLLQALGNSVNFKNNDALTSFSLSSKLDVSGPAIKLSQMHAKMDKMDVHGNIGINSEQKNITFNLNANQILIDDYLSNSSEADQKADDIDSKDSKNSAWSANGNFNIQKLTSDKLTFNNVAANLSMGHNIIRIAPLSSDFYSGKLNGSIVIDKHQKNQTAIYIKQSVKNMDIKSLLHEFSDADKLSGTTNLTANLSSVIDKNTPFLSALNGTINFDLNNGGLKGVDVIYQLSRAHAFVKRLPSPKISDSKETLFTTLSATGNVANGVIATDNLTLTSPYLKVSGKGTSNLVNKDISYRLNATAQPRLAAENDQISNEITLYKVPIKISGKLTKPSVNLDYVELAKNFYAKSIAKPISENLGKNINNLKDNLKEQVQSKIKSLSPGGLLQKLKNSDDKPTAPVEAVGDSSQQNADTAN